MNAIKSLFFAVMSLGIVGTTSVARAEEPAEEATELEVARADEEATEERDVTNSDQAALSSQFDHRPFDFGDFRRRGGRRECRDFCRDEYFRCERFDDRFRRHGYDRDRLRRRGRCEREFNFCIRRVCRGGRF